MSYKNTHVDLYMLNPCFYIWHVIGTKGMVRDAIKFKNVLLNPFALCLLYVWLCSERLICDPTSTTERTSSARSVWIPSNERQHASLSLVTLVRTLENWTIKHSKNGHSTLTGSLWCDGPFFNIYSYKVNHLLFQCKYNNRANKIQLVYVELSDTIMESKIMTRSSYMFGVTYDTLSIAL